MQQTPPAEGGYKENEDGTFTIPGMGTFPLPAGKPGVATEGTLAFPRSVENALPSIVGGTSAVFGGPGGMAAAGPLAGGTRALIDAAHGKSFDPVSVGAETGMNAAPSIVGKLAGLGIKPAMAVGAEATGGARNLVGGALAPIMKILGMDAPGELSLGGNLLKSGTPLESRAGLDAVNTKFSQMGGFQGPTITDHLDTIAQAIRNGMAIPEDAYRTLTKAGLDPQQISSLVMRRVAAVGHAAVGAFDDAVRR